MCLDVAASISPKAAEPNDPRAPDLTRLYVLSKKSAAVAFNENVPGLYARQHRGSVNPA